MASTKADNNRVAWTYTDDLGHDYRVSAKAVYVLDPTDGAKFGGSAAAGTVDALPRGFKMRKVKMTAAGQPDRWVVAYETTATLWTTGGTAAVLDVNGVDVSYAATAGGRRSEKRLRDGITQSA